MTLIRSHHPHKRKPRGAMALEYIMILAVIVIPIGLLLPVAINNLKIYSDRATFVIRLPFP